MLISYHLPTLFILGSSPVENAQVLEKMVELLIDIDLIHLKHHPQTPLLASADFGVVYGRTVEWMSIPSMYLAGYADCKSLASMRIAEIRNKGRVARPVFRFRQNDRGGTDYHILVQTAVNSFQDPSKELGMGQDEWAHM